MNEFDLIEKIKKKIPRSLQGNIPIGDDAGMMTPPAGHDLVWTNDVMVDGVDFRMDSLAPELVGRKALAINLSDLAAMGAKPLGFLISIGIPHRVEEKWILRFYDGLIDMAKEYKVACVGGDITKASEFFVSIALAGVARGREVTLRSNAKPGDWLGVTGGLGGSIQSHHFSFTPRLRESQFLVKNFKPTSMMDISDGLIQDLGHLLKASRVGAWLELGEIPISKDAVQLSQRNPMHALERACTDGEDFELLFTVSPRMKSKLEKAWRKQFPKIPLSWIGKVEKQKGIRYSLQGKKITKLPFNSKGFQHFK